MVYKPPDAPPSFTGTLWLNPDKTIGGLISDVFNEPIHLVATKEGAEYRVSGWRGEAPEFRRITIMEGGRENASPDESPEDACPKCEGRLYWRASVINTGSVVSGPAAWHCATCDPADSKLWLDGFAAPPKRVPAAKPPAPEPGKLL